MTGPDLKPCPFCGGNAEYRVTHDEGQRNDYDTIECLSCRAEMSVLLHWAESEGANRNTLTTAWNTRDPAVLAALPEVQALIAAAFEAAARACDAKHAEYILGKGHNPKKYDSHFSQLARKVRALTPADATAALAARDAAMRAQGLREAAEWYRAEGWKLDEDDVPDAILARADQIEKEGGA